MGDSDFVTKFYNLEGDTISERKKNFFKLLNAQRVPLTEEDLKDLQPRTYLEKQFQIDIFIYFNLSAKLLDVIKEGNAAFVCRILKHPQILKEAIMGISPQKIVNDFLPCTSYIVRMKILKKISFFLEESQMDEIIFWVHKRYGLNIALKILHTGSSDKIKEYLFEHEVTLRPRQMQLIFNKDPELLIVYLKHYKKLTGKVFKHNDLFKYIAQKNPDFWLKLQEKQIVNSVNVGRRTSKYIIDHNHDDFLNNIEHYAKFLRFDIIVRKLHGNFKEVYVNFFPRNISHLKMNGFHSKLLRYYPKEKQWSLFEQAFMEVFQKDILENLIYLNSDFLKMFPNMVIRNNWATIHYDNDKSKSEKFLVHCHPDKAIPLIKEKINVTSNIRKRDDLVELLIENCGENKDLASLENVLQYIWAEHRNEEFIFYINNYVKRCFKLELLNENHWNYINKIIAFMRLNNRLSYGINTFFLKYIEFLFLRGKSYKNELIAFLKDVHANVISFDIEVDNLELKKQLFIEIVNIYVDGKMFGDDFKILPLIDNIITFNEHNPEHYIDLSHFPKIVAWIESIWNKKYEKMSWEENSMLQRVISSNLKYPENPIVKIEESRVLEIIQDSPFYNHFNDIIKNMITKHSRSKLENDVLKIFLDRFHTNIHTHVHALRWFFINEPKTIIPYIEKIFIMHKTCISRTKVRLMSHLNVDKKLIDYCTEQLEKYLRETLDTSSASRDSNDTDTSEGTKPTLDAEIIKTLAILLPTNEYIEIIEKHFAPTNGGIENADETLNKIYLLQCQIAKYFNETQEPMKTLPTLMKFCYGDYLQSALPSLYGICYTTPEALLYSYIDSLSEKTISVKKHALYLSSELLNFENTVNMLQNTDKIGLSTQKYVFSATLKFFRKNPCETLLNMVVANLNEINKNDQETLTDLVKIKLPKKYTDFYIQKCWYFIESLGEDIDVKIYLETFLKSIIFSEDIIASSPDLCKHIITRYFKNCPQKEQSLENIYHFVARVLRYQKTDATYDFIFEIISEFKRKQSVKPIKKLFNDFYRIALEDTKSVNEIDVDNNYHIELFKQRWFNTFTSGEMFDEHFLLNLLYIKCKSYDQTENYARDVVVYLEELVAQYGLHVYNKFKNLLIKHDYAPKNIYPFLYNILLFKNSTLNCILVLDLLEESRKSDEGSCDDEEKIKIKDFHDKIVEILRTSNDPVVSMYLNSYINN